MKNEVWKPYSEFWFLEGSSWGRVRTLDRMVPTSRGNGKRLVRGRILKQCYNRYGYLYVTFSTNGKKVSRRVHRIIALCFLLNPDNLPQVNHKNCDRTDNNVDNLEWCDGSYNRRYTEKYGEALGHPMLAINLTTSEVSWFHSQMEASRSLGVNDGSINMVIKGKRKTAGGYWFTKADENAVETTKNKFGDEVADKVEKLMEKTQITQK